MCSHAFINGFSNLARRVDNFNKLWCDWPVEVAARRIPPPPSEPMRLNGGVVVGRHNESDRERERERFR